jgi:hypothetical protein
MFKPVVMKTSVYWHIKPCNPLKVNRRFGGICHHLQGWRVNQERKQHEAGIKSGLLLYPEDGGDMFLQNVELLSTDCTALEPTRCADISLLIVQLAGWSPYRIPFHLHFLWPPLWSSDQNSWIQIQRSRVRFPALPDFLRSSGSGTGSTHPREYNWGATWKK